VQGALDASGAGRDQMDDVIAGAFGDVTSWAPSSNTSTGLQGMVNALVTRLEQAFGILTNGNTSASTQAAGSSQVAAGYNSLTGIAGGGVASTGGLGSMGGLSTGAMQSTAAAQSMVPMEVWVPAAAAASTAAQTQQAASTSTAKPATTATTASASKTVPTKVQTAINRAKSALGLPYVWGGGNANGPTTGLAGTGKPGFDCSGLTLYAYAGAGVTLPHNANAQSNYGVVVARQDIQPGDLIFSYWDEVENGVRTNGYGHVQMATGYGSNAQVIEAPYTGADVRYSSIPSAANLAAMGCPNQILIKRLLH
jgi:peptidoglycan DL-endopeptidase RipA